MHIHIYMTNKFVWVCEIEKEIEIEIASESENVGTNYKTMRLEYAMFSFRSISS